MEFNIYFILLLLFVKNKLYLKTRNLITLEDKNLNINKEKMRYKNFEKNKEFIKLRNKYFTLLDNNKIKMKLKIKKEDKVKNIINYDKIYNSYNKFKNLVNKNYHKEYIHLKNPKYINFVNYIINNFYVFKEKALKISDGEFIFLLQDILNKNYLKILNKNHIKQFQKITLYIYISWGIVLLLIIFLIIIFYRKK